MIVIIVSMTILMIIVIIIISMHIITMTHATSQDTPALPRALCAGRTDVMTWNGSAFTA